MNWLQSIKTETKLIWKTVQIQQYFDSLFSYFCYNFLTKYLTFWYVGLLLLVLLLPIAEHAGECLNNEIQITLYNSPLNYL